MSATLEPSAPATSSPFTTRTPGPPRPRWLIVTAAPLLLASSSFPWGGPFAAWAAFALAFHLLLDEHRPLRAYVLTTVLALPLPLVGFDGLRQTSLAHYLLAAVITVVPLGFAGMASARTLATLAGRRSHLLALTAFSGSWSLIELVAATAWQQPLFLAYTQLSSFLPLLAYWGGPGLVSFGFLMTTGALYLLARAHAPAVAILFLTGILVAGAAHELRQRPVDGRLMVGLVQAGKPSASAPLAYASATSALLARFPRPDLVIWPEGALRTSLADIGAPLPPWSPPPGTTLVAGGFRRTYDGNLKNSVFALTTSSSHVVYDKQHLVPRYEDDLQAGRGPLRPVDVGAHRLGFLICWESLNYFLGRARVRAGSKLLVVFANDSWADGSATPRLHANAARMLAISYARPVVFAAATEASSVIAHDGSTQTQLPRGPGSDVAEVVIPEATITPFAAYGTGGVALGLALLLAGVRLLCRQGPLLLPLRQRRSRRFMNRKR